MKKIEEIIAHLKEAQKFCVEYYQPPWTLADEVIRGLGKFNPNEYNIFDIFSDEIIEEYILSSGEDALLAYMVEGKLEGFIKADSSEVKMVEYSDLVPLYVKVFNEWEEAGWITVTRMTEGKKRISIKIKNSNHKHKHNKSINSQP